MESESRIKQLKHLHNDEIYLAVDETRTLVADGRFSRVLRGFYLKHGIVAIKTCKSVEREIEKLKLIEEATLQQSAKHTNVVEVYGWTTWLDIFGIITEYSLISSLEKVLNNLDVTINPLLRLRICYDVSNGLEYIHDQQIVHGDIKPENILLTKNLHAKIGDFGSAQILVDREAKTNESIYEEDFSTAHTDLYSPPETLLFPMFPTQPPHDTYSFGVTTLILFGQKIPFLLGQMQLLSVHVLFSRQPVFSRFCDIIHNQSIQSDSVDDRKIIDVITDVMNQCWHQNPSDRPLMRDVKKTLQDLINEQDAAAIKQHAMDTARQMGIKKK